jgi:C1A family cysteine protease
MYHLDEEGFLFPNPITINGNPPDKWDWRNAEHTGIIGDWTTDIKDQAGCGSCWAFGIIATLETVYNIQESDPDIDMDLSEQMLVSCGMTYYPRYIGGCCGGSIIYTLKFLQRYGTVTERCFPYQAVDAKGRDYQDCDPGDQPSNDPVRCTDKCEEWQQEIIKIKSYQSLSDPDSIKNAIINYGPVVAAFEVYQDFFRYDEGVYEQNSNTFAGWHVISIVGYDDEQQCWICKNSWNEGWGEPNPYDPSSRGGWFRIKYGECKIDDEGNSAYINGFTKNKIKNCDYTSNIMSLFTKFLKLPIFKFVIT